MLGLRLLRRRGRTIGASAMRGIEGDFPRRSPHRRLRPSLSSPPGMCVGQGCGAEGRKLKIRRTVREKREQGSGRHGIGHVDGETRRVDHSERARPSWILLQYSTVPTVTAFKEKIESQLTYLQHPTVLGIPIRLRTTPHQTFSSPIAPENALQLVSDIRLEHL